MIWMKIVKAVDMYFLNLLLFDLIQSEKEVKKIGKRLTNIAKNNLVCKLFGIRFVAA